MSDGWTKSIAHRRHKNDRPPKWDGATINWSGWTRLEQSSLRFHHDDQCTDCGSVDQCYVNTGRGLVDDSEAEVGEDDIAASPVDRDGAPHHEDTCPECEDPAP